MTFAIIFDSVGVGEWLVLLAVILIVVGPKKLPSTARKFGQYYSKFRRAADGFKRQLLEMDTEFTNAVSEAQREVEQAAEQVEKTANEAVSDMGVDYNDYGGYDPSAENYGETDSSPTTPEMTAAAAPTATAETTPPPTEAKDGDSPA